MSESSIGSAHALLMTAAQAAKFANIVHAVYASILREITTKGDTSRFVKTERGKFALAPKR